MAKKIDNPIEITENQTVIDPASTVKIKFTENTMNGNKDEVHLVSGTDAIYLIKNKIAVLVNESN